MILTPGFRIRIQIRIRKDPQKNADPDPDPWTLKNADHDIDTNFDSSGLSPFELKTGFSLMIFHLKIR